MSDKTFYRLLTAIAVIGAVSLLALLLRTAVLFRDCSILSYIANRG